METDRSKSGVRRRPNRPYALIETEIRYLWRRPLSARNVLGEVAGRVSGAPDDAIVVVAVNDVVVGVSPLYRRGGADDSFVVLLPAGALEPADNTVRVGLLGDDGDVVELDVEG